MIDGDCLELEGVSVLLHGVDAPEAAQSCRQGGQTWRCGLVATARLIEATLGWDLRCEEQGRDRNGRVVAVCRVGDLNLNAWLVSQGWALAERQASPDYAAEQAGAVTAGSGIWGSDFVPPWNWRQGERLARNTSESGCGACTLRHAQLAERRRAKAAADGPPPEPTALPRCLAP